MASQIVNFLPPSYINTLTSTVVSMSGSIAAIQAVDAVQSAQISSMSGSIAAIQAVDAVQSAQISSMSGSIAAIQAVDAVQSAQISSMSGTLGLMSLRASYSFPSTNEIYSEVSNTRGGTSGVSSQIDNASLINILQPIQENTYTINVPLTYTYTGTELFSGVNSGSVNYKVYSYPSSTGSVITFTGGQNYSTSFTGANMVVSAPNDNQLYIYKQSQMTQSYQQSVSYFTKRGYALPDDRLVNTDSSLYTFFAGVPSSTRAAMAFRPILDANNNLISANVAAIYTNSQSGFITGGQQIFPPFNSSGTFRPYFINPSVVTIPVTRSFDTHQTLVNSGSGSIFWDQQYKVLTINIPTGSYKVYDTTLNPNNIPCLPTGTMQIFMNRFQGSFAFMTKDSSNEISFTNFSPSSIGMVQISPTLDFVSTKILNGVNTILSISLSSEGTWFHNFAGATLTPKNYRVPQALKNVVWSSNIGRDSSNDHADNPGQYLSPNLGDNPSTYLTELCGSNSIIESFDDPTNRAIQWDTNFITNPGYPETLSSVVITGPTGTFYSLSVADMSFTRVFHHEMMHSIQHAYGANSSVDCESQATALELDERVSFGQVGRRSASYMRYLMTLYRGTWELFLEYYFSGYTNPNAYTNTPSYGAAMFWDWMFRSIDPNRQVMRRHMEHMATQTLGPLLRSEPDLMSLWNLQNGGSASLFGYSAAGARISTNQALGELNSTNLKDVYADWCVASSLLRNNLSIPEQWRIKFPWWVYSASNPVDIKTLLVTPAGSTTQAEAAYFWDWVQSPTGSMIGAGVTGVATSYSDNIALEPLYPWWPKASYSSATTTGSAGTTRGRAIPGSVTLAGATGPVYVDRRYVSANSYATSFTQDLSDCTMLGFVIPDSFTGVQVSLSSASTGADVRAMVCRYTPDGGVTGTFNYSGFVTVPVGGSQILDTNSLKANPGYTKLIVANTTITDYGGWNNFLSKSYRFSANVTVTQLN